MKVGSLVQCISNDSEILYDLIRNMPSFKKDNIYTVADLIEGVDFHGKNAIGISFEEIKVYRLYLYVDAKYFAELQGPNEVNVQEIVDNAMLQTA